MVINYYIIGKRIRKIRKLNKLSQEKLAELVNISPAYLSRIENGKAQFSFELFLKIAFFLEKEPGYFLTGVCYSYEDGKSEIPLLLNTFSSKQIEILTEIAKIIQRY